MLDEPSRRILVDEWLARLGRGTDQVGRCETLGSGISGSATYRVRLGGEDVVLKITAARGERYVRRRARREIAFYRDLAGLVTLRVPRVVAAHGGPAGFALLLEASGTSLPPGEWPEERYLEAARQLARFHAAFWGSTARLSGLRWLRRRRPEDMGVEMRQARGYWRALWGQPHAADVLTADTYHWLQGLVARMPEVEATVETLPLTMCHGDCNPGNVLRDAHGDLIWIDWQEVGLGRGPEDLSFFLQQASVAGAAVPYDAALVAYHACLEAETGAAIPLSTVRRVVDAAELRSRVLHWPAYLRGAPAEQLSAMVRRIGRLAEGLLRDP